MVSVEMYGAMWSVIATRRRIMCIIGIDHTLLYSCKVTISFYDCLVVVAVALVTFAFQFALR